MMPEHISDSLSAVDAGAPLHQALLARSDTIASRHALKVDKLGVPEDASAALVGFMLHANSLGTARLTATYAR